MADMPRRTRSRRPTRSLLLVAILALAGGVELQHRFDLRDRLEDLIGGSMENVLPIFGDLPEKTASPGTTLKGRVTEIIDGDSLTLRTANGVYEVRLHEIDAPEYDQPWGSKAEAALARKVAGEEVRLEVEDVDTYDRSVGKLWLGGRDINRELVREGHVWVYRRYLDDRSLLGDEEAARESGDGLWGRPDPVPPWEWRRGRR